MNRTLAAAAVLALAACGRLDQVDITRSASVNVPGVPGAPAGSIPSIQALDIGGGDQLRAEGIDPGDVDSAKLRRLSLEVTAGDSLETWVDSVSIYVETAGQPRILLATKSGISALPAGTTHVDLDVDAGANLKPYLTAASSPVTVEATGRAPDVNTTVKVTATIRVDVNVSGLLN
ncbi:hypothetical protein [Anaeromyxobacter dehalogenans]|uniref:hypothetical protein n=1 Tax=Anaeromyxobacter dehalogenans TaxID=161493 RepID=UPI00059BC1E7|nr:hypothetical protein [Anaeromyxobacter dehalogenans]